MAEYRVTSPDGQEYKVTGPDGATHEQVLAQVKAYSSPATATKPAPAPTPAPQPEGSATDFIAGNLNKGVAAVVGLPVDTAQNIYNLGKAAVGVATGRPQDFPLVEGTPGGSQSIENLLSRVGMIRPGAEPTSKLGEYGARALQFIPGALAGGGKFSGRIPSPPTSAIGRATQPLKDIATHAAPRALAGAASGLTTQAATDIGGPEYAPIGAMLPGARTNAPGAGERATRARMSERFGNMKDIGIPIPPREMKVDPKQQKIQNAITKQMGMPEGTEIEPKTLEANRTALYKEGYESLMSDPALKAGIRPNKQFADVIRQIGEETRGAQRSLPETFKNTQGVMRLLSDYVKGEPLMPKVAIRAIKKLRADATTNLASDKPEQVELGQSQRKIAVALEDLIESNLPEGSESLQRFRQARTSIAQSHDVQAALDPVTRRIDPTKLSALQTQGRPLSGTLRTLAEGTGQFPGAVKPPKSEELFSKKMSPYGAVHPGAVAAHGVTKFHDPLTTSRIYQSLFVDPANKLTDQQALMVRVLLSNLAANQAQIPQPPEQ